MSTYLIQATKHLQVWTPVLGMLLPLVVAWVTKRSTSSGAQGVLFTFLAAVLGVVSAGWEAHLHDAPFTWAAAFTAALVAWGAGQLAHTAVWTHTLAPVLQQLGPVKDRPAPAEPEPAMSSVLTPPVPAMATALDPIPARPGRHEAPVNP